MANQNLSPTQNEKNNNEEIVPEDPCPVCNEELYLNNEFTQRIGLIDDFDKITGWICPHCKTEYDDNTRIVRFLGADDIGGEA